MINYISDRLYYHRGEKNFYCNAIVDEETNEMETRVKKFENQLCSW